MCKSLAARYSPLGFLDALDRANFHARGGRVVAFALDADVGVDDVNNVAFTDRLSGAFRFASAARNAIIQNFHCHRYVPPKKGDS